MLNIAVAYNKYSFIGQEFLTWLWFSIENKMDAIIDEEPEIQSLAMGNKIVLENKSLKDSVEVITIKGDEADLAEGIVALRKGATVSEMTLVLTCNDNQWRFSIKGESLAMSSLKVPETGNIEDRDDVDGAVIEKIFLCDKAVDIMESLYRIFIKQRISNAWYSVTLPALHGWISKTKTD